MLNHLAAGDDVVDRHAPLFEHVGDDAAAASPGTRLNAKQASSIFVSERGKVIHPAGELPVLDVVAVPTTATAAKQPTHPGVPYPRIMKPLPQIPLLEVPQLRGGPATNIRHQLYTVLLEQL